MRPVPLLPACTALLLLACASAGESVEASTAELGETQAQAQLVDGRLVVTTAMPAECAGDTSCVDDDADGLSDAWEDAILERLRPRLVLHPEEPLLTDPHDAFGLIARVFRPEGAPPSIVRVITVVAFSFDGGVSVAGFSMTGHDGDSERVGLELQLEDGGRRAVVRRAFFSAHENMPNDHSHLYGDDEIAAALRWGTDPDGQPRWLVFPSRSKHAEFANPETCAQSSLWGTSLFREACGESESTGEVVSPKIVNAGEREHPRIDDLGPLGFPGESAWDGSPFCGGLRANGDSRYALCAGAVSKKLSNDPFR